LSRWRRLTCIDSGGFFGMGPIVPHTRAERR
jgi:hypothetical protein